ncbi:MAG: acyl-CoA dehydrogenase family protein [Myxococcota bacterium]
MNALVEQAHALRTQLRAQSADTEKARRVPKETARQLADAGFFRMLVPTSLGGGEVHPRVFVEVLEAVGRGDGATGWIVMTGSTTGLLSAYLSTTAGEALFRDPSRIYAGVFAPLGKATPVEGGYRLSGRWPFASGVDNSSLRLGGGMVIENGAPRMLPSGGPEIRSFFFSAEDSRVVDTWDTSGLRGTGSHDLVVEDIFVPAEHSACVFADSPTHEGPLYSFPLFGLLSLGISAVGLGIARAALDAFVELAPHKRSGRKKLAETELAQVGVAQAEGELRAARALMMETVDAAWTSAKTGSLDATTRASLRLAATHAAHAAARTVDKVYHLGGGASIYAKSPLQRCFRDVHVMTQHIMVATPSLKPIGRVLMGLEAATAEL